MNNNNGAYYSNQGKPLSYYIKNFLLIFLFVVILIFLLLWLLPSKSNISPIQDQIFQSNLTNMKDVTTSYYTKDRLPENEGDSKKLTLQEMIDMKLLLNVTDKNGKSCNTTDSYTEITKLENEYKLKVSLKCGDTEDYIVTYLGCYNYCEDNAVCEKKQSPDTNKDEVNETEDEEEARHNVGGVAKEISTGSGYQESYSGTNSYNSTHYNEVVNNKKSKKKVVKAKKPVTKKVSIVKITKTIVNKITNVTVIITPSHPTPTPEPTKYTCQVVDGTYYDKNGSVVSPSEYDKSCKEPAKHYCEIVNGKYYDKDGNVVNGNEYEESCIEKPEPEKHYCQVIEGTYYDKDGKVVSPSEYDKSCKEPAKYYCEIVNGKYYDKDGNVVDGNEYEESCIEKPEPEQHYCQVIEGTYYDKDGKVVSPSEYDKSCKEPSKYYCEIVDDKYYDKDGNIVNGDEYEESCIEKPEPEQHYCEFVDGKYYDKDGNVTSKSDYEKSCKEPEPEQHYCEFIDNKYYDKDGNIVSKEDYDKSCNSQEEQYRYQYEKEVKTCHDKQYSEWSNWSNNIEYDPANNNIPWGQNTLTWYEKNGYTVKKYYEYKEDRNQPIYNVTYDKLLGYQTKYACDGYTYYIDTATSTTYYTTGTYSSNWSKTGTITTTSRPSSTINKGYVYKGMDYDHCASSCTLKPYYIYDVYTRTGGSKASTSMVSSTKSSVTVKCNVVKKKIPIYGKNITFAGYVTNKELKEKKTYYYHKKTRTLLKDAYCEKEMVYVWSYSANDTTLINQGYKYNGKKELLN